MQPHPCERHNSVNRSVNASQTNRFGVRGGVFAGRVLLAAPPAADPGFGLFLERDAGRWRVGDQSRACTVTAPAKAQLPSNNTVTCMVTNQSTQGTSEGGTIPRTAWLKMGCWAGVTWHQHNHRAMPLSNSYDDIQHTHLLAARFSTGCTRLSSGSWTTPPRNLKDACNTDTSSPFHAPWGVHQGCFFLFLFRSGFSRGSVAAAGVAPLLIRFLGRDATPRRVKELQSMSSEASVQCGGSGRAPTSAPVLCATRECAHTLACCPLLVATWLAPCTERSPRCNALIVHPRFNLGFRSFLDPRSMPERALIVRRLRAPLVLAQHYMCVGACRWLIVASALTSSCRVCSSATGSRNSVGSVVWESSLAVANFCSLCLPPTWWLGKSVVELGCGAGAVLGLTTAALGADAVSTDMPDIVRMARGNVLHNLDVVAQGADSIAQLVTRNPGSVRTASYLWGSPPADSGLRRCYDVVIGKLRATRRKSVLVICRVAVVRRLGLGVQQHACAATAGAINTGMSCTCSV